MPPQIPDNDIEHLIDRPLADGTDRWSPVFAYCVNLKVLNHTSGDGPNSLATPASVVSSFHTKENSDVSRK
jgi:hypothetical protein